MEGHPNEPEKLLSTPRIIKPPSPKPDQPTASQPSTSKVVIITPDQIAKLGLKQHIKTVFETQTSGSPNKEGGTSNINKLNQKATGKFLKKELKKSQLADGPRRKNIIVSKITIINAPASNQLCSEAGSGSSSDIPIVDLSLSDSENVTSDKSSDASEVLEVSPCLDEKVDVQIAVNKSSDNEAVSPTLPKLRKERRRIQIQPRKVPPKVRHKSVIATTDATVQDPSRTPRDDIFKNDVTEGLFSSSILVSSSDEGSNPEKQKIHVLSNEQISLPQNYIKQLKSNLPEKCTITKQNSFSSSVLIYKSPAAKEIFYNSDEVIELSPDTEIPTSPNSEIVTLPDDEISIVTEDSSFKSDVKLELVEEDPPQNVNTLVSVLSDAPTLEIVKLEENEELSSVPEETSENSKGIIKDHSPVTTDLKSTTTVITIDDCESQPIELKVEDVEPHAPSANIGELELCETTNTNAKLKNQLLENLNLEPKQENAVVGKPPAKLKSKPQIIDLTVGSDERDIKKHTIYGTKIRSLNLKTPSSSNASSNTGESTSKQATPTANPEDLQNKIKLPIIQMFADKIKNKLNSAAAKLDTLNSASEFKFSLKSKLQSALSTSDKKSRPEKPTTPVVDVKDKPKLILMEPNPTNVFVYNSPKFNNGVPVKTYSRINTITVVDPPADSTTDKEPAKNTSTALIPTPKKRPYVKKSNVVNSDEDDAGQNLQETNEPLKPTPKKRGRKKKSETLALQKEREAVVKSISPEPEEVIVSARGRKRKAVNYLALAEGKSFDAKEDSASKKPKRILAASVTSTATEEALVEGAPSADTPKRKRGRPRKTPVKEETLISDTLDSANEMLNKSNTGNAGNAINTSSKSISETDNTEDSLVTDKSVDTVNTSNDYIENCWECVNIKQEEDEVSISKRIKLSSSDLQSNEDQDEEIKGTDTYNPEIALTEGQEESKLNVLADQPASTPVLKKKPGRKKKIPEGGSQEELNESSPETCWTCAVCNKELTRTAWLSHKMRSHNNLAWKVGDPPLDLNDQKLVVNILTDMYKRRKPLYCELCGKSKKSVVGFLSHKSLCQKSAVEANAMRVKCDFCDRTVLPVSMVAHLKFCRGNEQANTSSEIVNRPKRINKDNEDFSVTDKRKAATKAASLIEKLKEECTMPPEEKKQKHRLWFSNFDFRPTFFGRKRFQSEVQENGIAKCRFEGCTFKTTNVDEICNHLFACDKKLVQGYTCKFCIITYNTKDDISKHMEEKHIKQENLSADEEPNQEDLEGDDTVDEDVDDNDKHIICNRNKPAISNKLNCEYETNDV